MCGCVSFLLWQELVLWREKVLKMRKSFDFLWAVSTKKSYWVTLLWSDSQCVYFVRPNTLLLCIFLFCIFLLYRTDPQVEVQIKILLKEAAIVSKMQTRAITLWFPEQCLLSFFILEKQLASKDMFLIRSELSNFLLLHIFFLYYIDLHPYSHYCFSKISRPFCASRNWWIIIVFLQRNSLIITIVSQKYWELLQPYSHYCFSKILRTFCASRNYWIIIVFLQCTLKKKSWSFWLTLFYSISLS